MFFQRIARQLASRVEKRMNVNARVDVASRRHSSPCRRALGMPVESPNPNLFERVSAVSSRTGSQNESVA